MVDDLLRGKNVLMVEDDMLIVMLIEDMLSDLGCRSIAIADSVESAMDLLAERTFDLATLDVNLDGIRSVPVAQALCERDIPFTFATGNDEHGFGERFDNHPVLKKPFNFVQFQQVLGNLLVEKGEKESSGPPV